MTESEIKTVILEELGRIAPEADLALVGPAENLRECLDIDSFDAFRFIVALNDRLGVEIPESDYGRLTTLDEFIRYLASEPA